MPRHLNAFKVANTRARDAEYQAMWQACDRTTRKSQYQASSVSVRQLMLHEALTNLIDRRRRLGKQMCGTSIDLMVERHLRREASQVRAFSSSPPCHKGNLANPMDPLNHVHEYAPPELILAAPTPCLDAAPFLKLDHESYWVNNAQGPINHTRYEDTESDCAPFQDSTNCQADQSLLACRIQVLEKEFENMRNMVSILWNYLHPETMLVPRPPEMSNFKAEESEEHYAMME
ncbi:hypothetical protein BGZ63DRAFT_429304 [Mariannaea sp. PMI_226]|nr:hypothetical protein BGZ63DRAFT_429304 [Mariannaea sp. PMI_226]